MCNDPLVTYLRHLGYSVIRLPRRDFRPLQILARQRKDLVDLGQLATIMVAEPGQDLPPITADAPAGAISGQTTGTLSLGVGLTLLGTFLGAMGAGNLGINGKYKSAKLLAFRFSDVLLDAVEIAVVDQFLGAADVNPNSKHVASLLEADEIFVVTAVIKSKKFTVEATGDRGTEAKVDVPEIQQIVGANVAVSASATQSSTVTYEAAAPLVFGFQAVRLFFDGGRYTAFEPLESGTLAAKDLETGLPERAHVLQNEGAFARFSAL